MYFEVITITVAPLSDFSVLKNVNRKSIAENCTQKWLSNSYLDIILNKKRPLNLPERTLLITTCGEILEVNQSQVPSKTEDIAKLKEMLQMTDRQSCKRAFTTTECLCCS